MENQSERSGSEDGVSGRVEEAGLAWAGEMRAALHAEGRPAAGGWPGTLSEARARVVSVVGRQRDEELERFARLLYGAARDAWLSQREPTPRD